MTIRQKLEQSRLRHEIVRIATTHPDEESFHCIVLANHRNLVVIREFQDFDPDGIVFLPKKWIRSVRKGVFDECATKIARTLAGFDKVGHAGGCEGLARVQDVLRHLQEMDEWPAIQTVTQAGDSFYLGKITETGRRCFRLHSYDAAGNWDEEYELKYDEVFKVEIQSRYVTPFNAYMRKEVGPPPVDG